MNAYYCKMSDLVTDFGCITGNSLRFQQLLRLMEGVVPISAAFKLIHFTYGLILRIFKLAVTFDHTYLILVDFLGSWFCLSRYAIIFMQCKYKLGIKADRV